MSSRFLLLLGALGLAVAGAGCAGLARVRIEQARTGEFVVHVRSAQGFDELAGAVYGDTSLGHSIAAVANLPYEEGVPAGTVLVLPVREKLAERVSDERAVAEFLERGLKAVDAHSYRAAAEHFRKALAGAPHRSDIRYNLGLALMRCGEIVEATGLLETAARERADDPKAHYALGSVLRRRRAFERALREFENALALEPGHAPAAFARNRTLEDLGRDREARAGWKRFLEKFASDSLAGAARERLARIEERIAASAAPDSALGPGAEEEAGTGPRAPEAHRR